MQRVCGRRRTQRWTLGLICGAVLFVSIANMPWLRSDVPSQTSILSAQAKHEPSNISIDSVASINREQTIAKSMKDNLSNQFGHLYEREAIVKPEPLPGGPHWQTVVAQVLWIYSAYLDTRMKTPLVKIFGMMKQNTFHASKFLCLYSFKDASPLTGVNSSVAGTAINIDPSHSQSEAWSIVIHCPVPPVKSVRSIQSVTVKLICPANCQTLNNSVQVTQISKPEVRQGGRVKFAVCTSPMFFNYSDVGEFLEMIEVGRMFGADKFIIYELSIGPALRPYIEYYRKRGTLEVLPWDLPLYDSNRPKQIHDIIHYFGQVISINDCVYRNMYRADYVSVTDLDELVVPLKTPDWHGMVAKYGQPSGLDFSCVFFRKEWPDDDTYSKHVQIPRIMNKLNLRTLLKTKSEAKIWGHKTRSKQMIRPEIVDLYHIHFVAKFIDASFMSGVTNVPEDEALLFHYRFWDNAKGPWVINRRMHDFSTEIIRRISGVYNTVHGVEV